MPSPSPNPYAPRGQPIGTAARVAAGAAALAVESADINPEGFDAAAIRRRPDRAP